MQTIEAHYEIVTPMFIGGGETQEPPELRPPSIKGALRFWWRALQWGACLQAENNNTSDALKLLHEREAALFGAAAKDDKYGQGKLQLRLKLEKSLKEAQLTKLSSGQTYLLGQGLYHFRNGLLKKALDANQNFTIRLKLADDVEPEAVLNTLLLWGLLGGLGSRSRKGWGSVAIRSLKYTGKSGIEIPVIPASLEAYKETVKKLLSNKATALPPFTAFSDKTRIDLSKTGTNALSLLGDIGLEMQMYRSYGKDGKVAGKDAERNFKDDHDMVLKFAGGEKITTHPKRVMFGLPHNYFFSNGAKVDVHALDSNGSEHRRSSPIFIHVHKFASGDCIAVQSLLKADFLPATDKIQLKGKKELNLACSVDWNVITQYLDRFTTKETIV